MQIAGHVRTSLPRFKPPKRKKETTFISTNLVYAGMHYRSRSSIAKRYHDSSLQMLRGPIDTSEPLVLLFVFSFNKNPYCDVSNLSYMGKQLEDALVIHGILPDDNTEYISEVRYRYRVITEGSDHCDIYFIKDEFKMLPEV